MNKDNVQASPFDDAFDKLAEKQLKDFHVPGLSIAVVDGEGVFSKAYGFAELPSTPATPETLYYIGSVTKNIFASTWVKYIQSKPKFKGNDISLDTKISEIIREDFVLQDQWATNHINIEDILCHRTGMTRHDAIYGGQCDTTKAVTRALRHLELSTEPRKEWDYCNNMYMAATHALETATGESVGQTMKQLILDPLGMKDTHTSEEAAENNAHDEVKLYHGYEWYGKHGHDGKGHFKQEERVELEVVGGAGFMISNVLDMAKYAKAWLGQNDVLSEELRAEVSRPRMICYKMPHNDQYAQYALGLERYFYDRVELFGHNGGLTGYTTLFRFVPKLNWGFISIGNSGTAVNASTVLLYHLLNKKLGLDGKKQFDYAARYHKLLQEDNTKKPLEEAIKAQYCSLPDPRLNPPLPIEKYAGVYSHPAYRTFTFRNVTSSKTSWPAPYLQAHAADRSWHFILQLFHVSGEFWLGYKIDGDEDTDGQSVSDFRAVSKTGFDGTVEAFGLELESDQERKEWRDKLIWFDRVKK